jgi:general stress protein 26
MKIRLTALVLFCIPSFVVAQAPATTPPTRDQILTAARTIIQNARFATFVTLDEKGAAQARIVDPFPPDSQFTVWIGTNSLTRKVRQIAHDRRVVLLWFDGTGGYASLSGRAELVRDSLQKEKHWKAEWKEFYRNANHGDDYMLIRVTPMHMEVVGKGMVSDPKTWLPVMIDFPAVRTR